jgi:hypothetical protein
MLPFVDVLMLGAPLGGSAWNPSDKDADVALLDSNYRAAWSNSGAVRGTQARGNALGSGKRYFEVVIVKNTFTRLGIGIANSSFNISSNLLGTDDNSMGYVTDGGTGSLNTGFGAHAIISPFVAGSAISIAVNFTTGRWWAALNGTYVAGGDPVAGTNGIPFTNNPADVPPGAYFPAAAGTSTTGVEVLLITQGAFLHPIPSGYSAWG